MQDILHTTGRLYHAGWQFPIGMARGVLPPPSSVEGFRFALVFIEKGAGLIGLDGHQFLVTAPSALLLDECLRPVLAASGPLQFTALSFEPAALNDAFALERLRAGAAGFSDSERRDFYLLHDFLATAPGRRVQPLAPGTWQRVTECLARIEEEGASQSDHNWPCRIRSFVIELLFCLRLSATDGLVPVAPTGLDRALALVHQRFAEDFSVETLARWCHTNRTTLNAHFLARTGMPVKAYVASLRMNFAASLLRDTLLPVSEILGRVGYQNASHFARAFRASTGLSPRAYRERENWILPHLR
ncbi:AraC family transcriptional regulator [Niveibacterium sp. SC-1]|uniref:AraC family transcriptional regulator n=1 Tax=Niveibacterium sp. SC-1 TaxID=3135646 RepID=UPI00311FD662